MHRLCVFCGSNGGSNEQFIAPHHRKMAMVDTVPEGLLAQMRAYRPSANVKWI